MSKALFDKRFRLVAGDTVYIWHYKPDGTRSNELSYTHGGEPANVRLRVDLEMPAP